MPRIDPDERQSFLEAIRDAGDDPGPALVYADFLEENGEGDQASVIRDHCAWEALPEWTPGYLELENEIIRRSVALTAFGGVSSLKHGLLWKWAPLDGHLMPQMTTLQATQPACALVLHGTSDPRFDDWQLGSLRSLSLPADGVTLGPPLTTATKLISLSAPGRDDLTTFAPVAGLRSFHGYNWHRRPLLGYMPFTALVDLELETDIASGLDRLGDWQGAALWDEFQSLERLRLPAHSLSERAVGAVALPEAFPRLQELQFDCLTPAGSQIGVGQSLPWVRRLKRLAAGRLTASQLLELGEMFGPPILSIRVGMLVVATSLDAAAMSRILETHRNLEELRVERLSEEVSPLDFLLDLPSAPGIRVLQLPFALSPLLADALARSRWPKLEYLRVGNPEARVHAEAVLAIEGSDLLETVVIQIVCANALDRRHDDVVGWTGGRISFAQG